MSERQTSLPRGVRVGVDVGGTFTDIVVSDPCGAIHAGKLASTPEDFSRAWRTASARSSASHAVDPAAVRDVVHGSTVATNAILERKGARTGLLTTVGFGDVLELRRLRMPRLYDMTWEKPRPLVERYLRREVPERVAIDGSVVTAARSGAVRRAVQELVAEGVESLAVSLLHSYANPDHEKAIGALLASEFPELWVSLSHRILPVIREYERTSTTVLNAYVQPTVASYLAALRRQLDATMISGPLLIMQSNGGIMAGAAAAERPAYIVESGPAAGVIASAELARQLGIDEVITFDMGGTTAKASHRRARPAALHSGVRGRGRDLGQQPPVEWWRLRPVRPVHRPRRDRRRRRQPHLARPGRRPARRSDVGRGRPWSGLLRQGRRPADRH